MIDDALVVVRADPLNCETRVAALMGGTVMPTARFYIRSHFAVPELDGVSWRLQVGGLVDHPMRLGLRELLKLPEHSIKVTLECAGNGRAYLTPTVGGEQWRLGAVSTAEWTGVRLGAVLERAGVGSTAREVVFKGAEADVPNRFERSLTLDEVRESQPLLAYAMNGEPLPVHHGYPLRLIVPGWYGVASVKWLTEIELIDHAFTGYFQTDRYVYEKEPVRHQRVRALVIHPAEGEAVDVGTLAIRGLAWSGVAPVERVEVRINDQAWQPARLVGESSRYEWQPWELITDVERPGRATIRARATDLAGRTQPEKPEWNSLGYGNNAIHELSFEVKATGA